jgi:polysaccharide biosynthesis transport protein
MPKPDVTNSLTLRGLFLILQRRRSVLITFTAACFFLAVLVCIFMTRKYEASGAIQVAKTSFGGLGLDSMVSPADVTSDALTENVDLQTQAGILQSDTLALQVVENLNLENTKDFQPKWNPIGWLLGLISPSGQADAPNAPLERAPLRRTRVLKVFSKNLKVEPVAGSRIIDVTFLSSNPQTAAAVVNELTRALVDYGFQSRSSAMSQGSEWLSSQLSDVKKQAETLQQKVVELQKGTGVYSLGTTDDQTGKEQSYSITLDHLQQGTQALTAAESTRIQRGGIYEMVKSGDPELISGLAGSSLSGASPGVMNSFNLIQTLRGQEATLESQLANDSSKFGPAYPKLADERASLASIRQQIKQEVARIGERAANDYRSAQADEDQLRQSYNRDRAEASKINDKAMEYTIARQEATQAEQLYQTLYQRMKEAGVVQGLPATNVTVVDPARVPGRPVKPNVPVYLAGSIFAGLFLGSVAAFFLDTISDKVQILKPVAQELRLHCLGALPSLAAEGRRLSLPGFRQKLLPRNDAPANSGRLAIVESSSTAFAEALRSVRTTIQLA